MNFIKTIFSKIAAKQLRKPGGILAGKVGNEMNKTNAFLYDLTVETMELRDKESILEIGFGNGKLFDKVFSAANDLKISGIDFSPEMVREAQKANPSTSKAGDLVLRLGSSDKIPFADHSFDKVFCINVIYFWEQPADHLKEIHRVLKPGGRFYTTIRNRDSLVKMPFTKYGFKIYAEDEWMHLLQENHLHFEETRRSVNEPDTVFDGKHYKAGSLCMVAEKAG